MDNNYAIITIGWKSLAHIKNRLEEAYKNATPNEFIVIINHFSDESYKILDYVKNEPRVTRYVYCSQNIGFAKAMNLGYKMSWSDYLIILSDDCATNSETHKSLVNALIPEKIGLSCVILGGKSDDIIPIPQGFLIAIKTKIIPEIGNYIYDEVASPLGCERELAYRVKTHGYDTVVAPNCTYGHVHDVSNNPRAMIHYLGKTMSPQGEKAFQFVTEGILNERIAEHKRKLQK